LRLTSSTARTESAPVLKIFLSEWIPIIVNYLNGLNFLNVYFPFKIFQTFSRDSCLPVTIHFQSVSSKYLTPALGRLPGLRYVSSISVRSVAEP
jgi:hypothetical protein